MKTARIINLFLLFALAVIWIVGCSPAPKNEAADKEEIQEPGSDKGKEYMTDKISIYNPYDKPVKIIIGLDNASIGASDEYVSPPLVENPIVTIKTKDKSMSYTLELGKSYQVTWDKNKKCYGL